MTRGSRTTLRALSARDARSSGSSTRRCASPRDGDPQVHRARSAARGGAPRGAPSSFGGIEQVQGRVPRRDGAPLFETLLQDVRYGVRGLRRNPGYHRGRARDARARDRRQRGDLQRRPRRLPAVAPLRRRRPPRAPAAGRARPQRRAMSRFSPMEIADYAAREPHARRRGRVPLDVVHPARQAPSPSASRPASSRPTTSTCWA